MKKANKGRAKSWILNLKFSPGNGTGERGYAMGRIKRDSRAKASQ